MDTRKVATTLATQTTIVVLVNMCGAWLSRWVTWNPQDTLPGVISACIYTPTYFTAFKAQEAFSNKNYSHNTFAKGQQPAQVNRIRWISCLIGIIATTNLTPPLSKYFESSVSKRASFIFSLPAFAVSCSPYSKERGI